MLLYQLVNFERNALDVARKIRCEFKVAVAQGYRWIEWNESIREIAPHPDVSIVFAKDLSWRDLASVLNDAKSVNVVILGNNSGILALPCFKGNFDVRELNAFMHGVLHETASPRRKNSHSKWVETIPMPLPNMNSTSFFER
ncbi:hypothetical protein AEP_01691 [Curvibacter sp. AEP1-3]|uniref:hypothetical protein n=1 Tax=Curvibacter sp. AEP1-3 TaxID=1844971 RepID=UPI000B586077|nr:hypothetical protein [Curvibacter sp. AEP1-3]ARV18635.1 hypothetical protein AEP_01691 [Curvibacter sp. AEP1-3]